MSSSQFDFDEAPGLDLVVAGVVHDVRGALSVIKLLASTASSHAASGDVHEAMQMLARMNAAVARGSDLCDDALECGRRRAVGPQTPLAFERFDLVDVVGECVSSHAGMIADARCIVEVVTPASATVLSHRRSNQRVLTNLLCNALRYGSGRPIQVRVHAGSRCTVVMVRDHGRGIPDDVLPRIFTPWKRGSEDDLSFQRFGLGLWIAQNLVKSLGGTLHVASERGIGTAISYVLPVDRPLSLAQK